MIRAERSGLDSGWLLGAGAMALGGPDGARKERVERRRRWRHDRARARRPASIFIAIVVVVGERRRGIDAMARIGSVTDLLHRCGGCPLQRSAVWVVDQMLARAASQKRGARAREDHEDRKCESDQ